MSTDFLPLNRTMFELAEHAFLRFNAMVPAGTTKEVLEDPKFWSHVQAKLRTFHEIRVVADDGSFVAELFVQSAGASGAYVKVLNWFDLEQNKNIVQTDERYKVEMRGRLGWCLVDTIENNIVKQNCGKESDAHREKEEYLRALAS